MAAVVSEGGHAAQQLAVLVFEFDDDKHEQPHFDVSVRAAVYCVGCGDEESIASGAVQPPDAAAAPTFTRPRPWTWQRHWPAPASTAFQFFPRVRVDVSVSFFQQQCPVQPLHGRARPRAGKTSEITTTDY